MDPKLFPEEQTRRLISQFHCTTSTLCYKAAVWITWVIHGGMGALTVEPSRTNEYTLFLSAQKCVCWMFHNISHVPHMWKKKTQYFFLPVGGPVVRQAWKDPCTLLSWRVCVHVCARRNRVMMDRHVSSSGVHWLTLCPLIPSKCTSGSAWWLLPSQSASKW